MMLVRRSTIALDPACAPPATARMPFKFQAPRLQLLQRPRDCPLNFRHRDSSHLLHQQPGHRPLLPQQRRASVQSIAHPPAAASQSPSAAARSLPPQQHRASVRSIARPPAAASQSPSAAARSPSPRQRKSLSSCTLARVLSEGTGLHRCCSALPRRRVAGHQRRGALAVVVLDEVLLVEVDQLHEVVPWGEARHRADGRLGQGLEKAQRGGQVLKGHGWVSSTESREL